MKTVYVRGDYHVCPSPLSADSYSICEYSCKYCFVREMYASTLKRIHEKGLVPTDLKELKCILSSAFDTRKESKNPTVLALRAELPVIIGRKSDPFCPSEAKYHNTEGMMKLFHDYGVSVFAESKGINLNLVAKYCKGALVSIMPADPKMVEKLEPGCPSVDERFEFAKAIKKMGLYVSITGEPLLPLADAEIIKNYAEKVKETKADHVNFGEYRTGNPRLSQTNLAQVGIDFRAIMKTLQTNWLNLGREFMTEIKKQGIKCSTPDWVNFGLESDCEGCCGLDSFNLHHFTFQKALRILKENGKVRFSDLIEYNIFGDSYLEEFRKKWNDPKRYFGLTDVKNVSKIGFDGNGDVIYGKNKGLSSRL